MSKLGDFLVQRFQTDELFRLLWGFLGNGFVSELPNYQTASRAGFAMQVELHLRDRGAVDAKLFDRLMDERANFQADIADIAREEGQAWPRGGVVAAAVPTQKAAAADSRDTPPPRREPEPIVLDIALSAAEVVAQATLNGGRVLRSASLKPASKTLESRVSRLRAFPGQRALGEQVGDGLSNLIFRGAVRGVYDQTLAAAATLRRPLQIRLQLRASWERLPWELLRLPDEPRRFIAQQQRVWLTRELALGSTPLLPPPPDRPRVLLAGANTVRARSLPVDEELRELKAIWRKAGADVVVLKDTTWKRLRDALGDQPWSLLHFAGHGEPGCLIMSDGVELQGREIADMVAGGLVARVYLNACSAAEPGQGAPRGRDFGWDTVATMMVGEGCTDAVAFGAPLDDKDGLCAALPWHRALAGGQDPVRATASARYTLRTSEALGFGFLQHFTTSR